MRAQVIADMKQLKPLLNTQDYCKDYSRNNGNDGQAYWHEEGSQNGKLLFFSLDSQIPHIGKQACIKKAQQEATSIGRIIIKNTGEDNA